MPEVLHRTAEPVINGYATGRSEIMDSGLRLSNLRAIGCAVQKRL
jgi:hypothetical protein